MASSIQAATLTVTISEDIILNTLPINSKNDLTIENVSQFDKRIMEVPVASEVTLVSFASAVAAGSYVRDDVKYIRVTNKDTTNYARIRLKRTGSGAGDAYCIDSKLDAGKSMMFGNVRASANINGGAFTNFVDMDAISAQAYTAAVDVEFVVAST